MHYYDLHCHSINSMDSINKIESIVKSAKKRGLDGVAITDHDGVFKGKTEIDGIKLIPGSEITLKDGSHLLAYFINKPLKERKNTLKEAVKKVKKQGGFTSLAHPFRTGGGWFNVKKRKKKEIKEMVQLVDMIETANAKDTPRERRGAKGILKKFNHLIPVAGSDAHAPIEVGKTAIKTKEPLTSNNFLKQLREGEIIFKNKRIRGQKGGAYFRSLLTKFIKDSRIYHNKKAKKAFSKFIFCNILRVKNVMAREVKPCYKKDLDIKES
ncbi:MAG: PHP domain-containing protein [Minisyncoccales bacterium]